MQTSILETSQGNIEYSISGHGSPIVIIHGGHSHAQEILTHKYLDPTLFTIICPSRPGYGNTPLQNHHSISSAVDIIAALLKTLPYDSFGVIGISAGGPIAIALTASKKTVVNKLVLASAVSKNWLTIKDRNYKIGKVIFHPYIESLTWRLVRIGIRLFPTLLIKQMAKDLTTKKIISITPEELKDMTTLLNSQRSKQGFLVDIHHQPNQELLTQIIVPTLIVHSENDVAVNISHAHFAKENISHAILHTFQNKWGHLIWIGQDARKINQHISTFLLEE